MMAVLTRVGHAHRQAVPASDTPVARVLLKHRVPALGGMVVTPDGVELLEVAGVRRAGSAEAATVDDRWHLGSNGKAMTAVLFARLVQRGKASWEARLADVWPQAKHHQAWSDVTVVECLQHRAGVADATLIAGDWLARAHRDSRPVTVQRREAAAVVLGKKPGGRRGTFAYANANYVLVGAAIEQIMGASWEDLMRSDVFAPLGITSGGFGAPTGANPWGHSRTRLGLGGLGAVDPAGLADNPPVLGPAGTIHMRLRDYATFLRLFMGTAGEVLTAESVRRLTTPPESTDRSYAMGWITFVSRPWAQGQVLAHEGSNTLWHAFTAVGPVRRRAVVAVCNAAAGGGAEAAQALALELTKHVESQ